MCLIPVTVIIVSIILYLVIVSVVVMLDICIRWIPHLSRWSKTSFLFSPLPLLCPFLPFSPRHHYAVCAWSVISEVLILVD